MGFTIKPSDTSADSSLKTNVSTLKPKGEIQITVTDCTVVSDTYDHTYGYMFKFKNQYESVTLAAGSTIERKLWMKLLNATIDAASK